MNFTIEPLWVYGYKISDLGEYKYNADLREGFFTFAGQKFPSAALAFNFLREKLRGRYDLFWCNDIEPFVGFQIEGFVGELNEVPEITEELKQITKVLQDVGVEVLIQPKLYFLVQTSLGKGY